MAKPARFKVGSSGSGKHTEVVGTGEGMGGPASRPSEMGPRIGAGVLGRVRPEYDREAEREGGGRPRMPKKMPTYSEE
ncbi:MAG: hypothetical protein WCC64_03330 [Aliidongia sp.]|jgi:hypothetical protein